MKCPKCKADMEEGILVEYDTAGGIDLNVSTPKKQTWAKKINSGLLSDSIDKEIQVVAYRCKKCGYIESYAKE